MSHFETTTKRITVLSVCVLAIACSGRSFNPADHVDPFIGTGFHGHTYPGATAPNGAVQLSPDTRKGNWDACSGYHYSDSTIIGFSHTHLSGTGCIDLGDILFHPTTSDETVSGKEYIFAPLDFSHKDETASPGYYSVNFRGEGIKAELTATTYSGMHRYTYEKGKSRNLIIDMSHLLTEETIDMLSIRRSADNEITGMRRTQGWTPDQYVFFAAQFSENFSSVDFVDDGNILKEGETPSGCNRQAILRFGISDGRPIVAKVGFSIVSEDNARENLTGDIEGFDFDAVRKATYGQWNEALSDIVIQNAKEADLKNFYTALYRTKVVPNIISDRNGQYRRHDMTTASLEGDGRRYSTFSIWDTYRAWNPLITLTDHRLVSDMINSYLDIYDVTGELPIWPLSAGETGTMIGYHSVSVIADAYMKGIRGFDAEKAFEAMKRSSNINKKGSDYYTKYGYIPSNIKMESVSCLLEYAYDDWCIAQMARELGKTEEYEEYTRRACYYANVFDGHTRFFRGKRLDGNWDSPFNQFAPGRAYTEATAWQYRFYVPHDVNGMAQLFGGREAFAEQLDSLFTVESKVDGHMSDITGLIGQYAHGNEPSHHMAYLYNYVGQPWKTQAMTRRILDEMYHPTPEGIIGNEDCGQMSAWYIFSSLGFYPVCPGSSEFALTTPLFPDAAIRLANGKTLNIKSNDPQKNRYIGKVVLNGEEIDKNYVTYGQIMEGGTLDFILTDRPDLTRGTAQEAYPYSLTERLVASIPYTTCDLDLFVGRTSVDLASATPDVSIHYTTDGSEPDETSALYSAPFGLESSATIKARAYRLGYTPSRTFTINATKAVFENPSAASGSVNGTNYRYYEGYYQSVYDIEKDKPAGAGVIPAPSIEGAAVEDHFAFVFTGFVMIPEDGVYEFVTRSDDGSVLYIGDKKTVDNDGSHAAIAATGRIALRKGLHPYKLLYFEDYEGQHLSWGWKTPSSKRFEEIPESSLFTK